MSLFIHPIPGDYVEVHTEYGCLVGKFISDDGDTYTIEFDHGFLLHGVPKQKCDIWVKIRK